MNRSNRSIILSTMGESENEIKTLSEIPAGYIEVRLSTKGKVGAPKMFHIRNFKVKDIVALSMSNEKELPIRLASILNEMIWEDVNVFNWHEKEVEELMLYVFMTFFKQTFDDIPFPLNEDDMDVILSRENGDNIMKAIGEGKYVPRTTVNIGSDIDTYDVADDFNPRVTITNKKTGFHVTFDYVKYGDYMTVYNWLNEYFADDERRFDKIRKQIEYNEGISNQFKNSPESIDKLVVIDSNEEKEYRDYLVRRAQGIAEVVRLVSVVDYDGQDVSNLSLEEKYNLMSEDARIDAGLINKLDKRQKKMKFGLKPEVSMFNPITKEVVKRPVSFRIPFILQAMQLSGNDDYDDGYDDED